MSPSVEGAFSAAYQGVASESDVSWADIRGFFTSGDERTELLLDLFEAAYSIETSADAFSMMKHFLGSYLVKEFDHKGFCKALGVLSSEAEEDEELCKLEADKRLDDDLQAATSFVLRLAMTIAKAYGLRKQDWEDVNRICGSAVRILPACHRLQQQLPGALNDARALKALSHEELPSSESEALSSLNPWTSVEGQDLFEQHHQVAWSDMEALTENDGPANALISGIFSVLQVVEMPALSIVHLQFLRKNADEPMAKNMQEGDVILWEVDSGPGSLLEVGMILEGHWRELQSEICFLTSLKELRPSWLSPEETGGLKQLPTPKLPSVKAELTLPDSEETLDAAAEASGMQEPPVDQVPGLEDFDDDILL